MQALTTLLGTSPAVFIGLTIILAGGAAMLAGQAIGDSWRPAWQVVAAAFGLALVDRFLTFALFGGELLSLWGFIVHFLAIAAMGLVAWRVALVSRFVNQYPWRYRRRSPFGYVEVTPE